GPHRGGSQARRRTTRGSQVRVNIGQLQHHCKVSKLLDQLVVPRTGLELRMITGPGVEESGRRQRGEVPARLRIATVVNRIGASRKHTELTPTLVLAPLGVQTLATQFWAYQSEVAYGTAALYGWSSSPSPQYPAPFSGSGSTGNAIPVAWRRHAGTVTIGGQVVDDGHRTVRTQHRDVGYVPQEGALFPHLTVKRNIGFGMLR